MEVGGQRHSLAALLPGKEPRHKLNMKLGGPQSWSRPFMRRENYSTPAGKITFDRPTHTLNANLL
jgi:hypothetical protein